MKIIDLFCGAGGFSLGFSKAGFNSIASVDLWNDAIETINLNSKKKVGINIDIKKFNDEVLPDLIHDNEITGIIGGPPCQGFSMVGTRNNKDDRNNLYLEYVRTVEITKPKFFVLENVTGLLSMNSGYFKEDIIKRFSALGYNVSYSVLNASLYGIPQSRKRVFFIGINKDFKDEYFEFESLEKKQPVTCSDALSDLPAYDQMNNYKLEPQNNFQVEMRKNTQDVIFNNDITNHQEKTIEIIKMVPDGGSIRDLPEEYYKIRNYNAAFKRMNSKGFSSTIDCGHRNYFHYKYNRVPTVRESARIQTFPDDYKFYGSKTSQYTQVGNAVPVELARLIAVKIKEAMEI